MNKYDFYTLKVTIQHCDGRVCVYRYSMNRDEFGVFFDKILNKQGDVVVKIEDIRERTKYYS